MNELLNSYLANRRIYLEQIISAKKKALKNVPSGSLHICHKGKATQYYLYKGKERRAQYLCVTDRKIMHLAQKDYDERILDLAIKELDFIEKMQRRYQGSGVDELYETLSPDRQRLVKPVVKPDDVFAAEWQAVTYQGNPYKPDNLVFGTARGDKVRSKSEAIIADRLFSRGIPYHYEKPLKVGGTVVYPDFTVLNVRKRKVYYHEHAGMIDCSAYSDSFIKKINSYHRHGIIQGENLIITYEDNNIPLDTSVLDSLIEKFYL